MQIRPGPPFARQQQAPLIWGNAQESVGRAGGCINGMRVEGGTAELCGMWRFGQSLKAPWDQQGRSSRSQIPALFDSSPKLQCEARGRGGTRPRHGATGVDADIAYGRIITGGRRIGASREICRRGCAGRVAYIGCVIERQAR